MSFEEKKKKFTWLNSYSHDGKLSFSLALLLFLQTALFLKGWEREGEPLGVLGPHFEKHCLITFAALY